MKYCLKEKSAADIVKEAARFPGYFFIPFTIFGPVVEPYSTNAFLVQTPDEVYKSEKGLYRRPWMATFVKDDIIYSASEFIRKGDQLSPETRGVLGILPYILEYDDRRIENLTYVSNRISEHYLQNWILDADTFDNVAKVEEIFLFEYKFYYEIYIFRCAMTVYTCLVYTKRYECILRKLVLILLYFIRNPCTHYTINQKINCF